MGNAVGPVALIAAGIYLGYLTLTGRAGNLVAFIKSGGTALASGSSGGSSPSPTSSNLSNAPASSTGGILQNTAIPGTASNMSAAQAANAATQTIIDLQNSYGVSASSN